MVLLPIVSLLPFAFTFVRSAHFCYLNISVPETIDSRSHRRPNPRVLVGCAEERIEIHLIANPDEDQAEARRLLMQQFARYQWQSPFGLADRCGDIFSDRAGKGLTSFPA